MKYTLLYILCIALDSLGETCIMGSERGDSMKCMLVCGQCSAKVTLLVSPKLATNGIKIAICQKCKDKE